MLAARYKSHCSSKRQPAAISVGQVGTLESFAHTRHTLERITSPMSPVNRQSAFLPITIENVHEEILDCFIVEGTMRRDFGPWRKDEHKCLTFNFDSGTCIEYGDDGIVVSRADIAIQAV